MSKIIFVIMATLFSFQGGAGVSVLGTFFVMDDEVSRLGIKLKNDNEGDFLIKTTLFCENGDKYIVTPPLFILNENASNVVNIISNRIEKDGLDHLCRLSIASIPRSPASVKNGVYLAIRSNFHFVYRHNELKNADFTQLKLTKNGNSEYRLINGTTSVLSMVVSLSSNNKLSIKKTVAPGKSMPVSLCGASQCNLNISIIGDDQAVMQKLTLSTL